uniref:Uncharacterized protein n=1 Tax=Arundo donax TaxID=35708 RepID=A0A0A8YD29_ARUDO
MHEAAPTYRLIPIQKFVHMNTLAALITLAPGFP